MDFYHGVDTLYLSLHLDWFSMDFFDQLSDLKEKAISENLESLPFSRPSSWIYDNEEFNVHSSAPGLFSLRISSGDIVILLSRHSVDSRFPNCRIEIGSISCNMDWLGVASSVYDFLRLQSAYIRKQSITRIDLFCDIIGLPIADLYGLDNPAYWVCRANKSFVYQVGKSLTGIQKGSGDMCLRVYDKRAELHQKKSTAKIDFLETRYGISFADTPVTRVEFQLRSKKIKKFKMPFGPINGLHSLDKSLNAFWAYCVTDWSVLSNHEVDYTNKNQKRAIPHDIWSDLANLDFGFGVASDGMRKSPDNKNLRALVDQLTGIAISVSASSGLPYDDVAQISDFVSGLIEDRLTKKMKSDEVSYKKLYKKRANQNSPKFFL